MLYYCSGTCAFLLSPVRSISNRTHRATRSATDPTGFPSVAYRPVTYALLDLPETPPLVANRAPICHLSAAFGAGLYDLIPTKSPKVCPCSLRTHQICGSPARNASRKPFRPMGDQMPIWHPVSPIPRTPVLSRMVRAATPTRLAIPAEGPPHLLGRLYLFLRYPSHLRQVSSAMLRTSSAPNMYPKCR